MGVKLKNGDPLVPKLTKADKFNQHLADDELVSKPAQGTVVVTQENKKLKSVPKTLKDEHIELNPGVTIPKDKLCQVSVGGTQTINLGNFESAKVSVMLTMPCSKDDINETFEYASTWVSDKISQSISDAKN